jgi:hypothetical protein
VIGWIVYTELERIWKETLVIWLELLPRHLPGGTETNHGNLSQGGRSCDRGWNQAPR